MMLSTNFSLAELTRTDVRGVDNDPNPIIVANLTILANKLEEVRSLLGNPIRINSGYRSSAVNQIIGGSKNSKHMQGLAADFTCHKFGNILEVCTAIRDSGIKYDQLIMEFFDPTTGRGWIHIGLGRGEGRQQTLSINKHGTFIGLHP